MKRSECRCPPPDGAVVCPFTGYVDTVEWQEEKHNAGWRQTKCPEHGLWSFWWPPVDNKTA